MQLVATDIGSAQTRRSYDIWTTLLYLRIFTVVAMSAEEEVKASDFNFAGSNFMHDAVNSWCAPHYLRLPTYTAVEGNED